LGNIPGNPLNVGMTERGGIRGQGSSWIVPYVASQIPFTNWLVNTRSSIKTQQRGSVAFGADLAYLTGLNFREADNKAQVEAMVQQIKDEVAKKKRGYRDEGLIPEAAPQNSPFDQFLRQTLAQSLGR
jgi:hypothetical protein